MRPSPADSQSEAGAERNVRLWRLRHQHDVIDAFAAAQTGGVELRLSYNGQLVYRQGFARQDDAVREGVARRAGLERVGWTRHW